jgi:hypothetical protein
VPPWRGWLVRAVAAAWMAAIGVGLIVGATGSATGRGALLDDAPGCVFKLVTGVDCAFCGMTHATVALGAGEVSDAHHAHPLAVVVVVGALAIFAAIVAGRGELLLRGRGPLVILCAVAAIWAVRLIV